MAPGAPRRGRRPGPRLRAALVAAGALAGAGAVAAVTSGGGGGDARAPAAAVAVTGAARGPAGVVVVRDATLVRLDRQSPPGRLVVPPGPGGRAPEGVAVGRQRVWLAQGGVVRGHAPGVPAVRALRLAPRGPLLLAEGGGALWGGVPGARRVWWARLSRRPVSRAAMPLPGPLRALASRANGAYAAVAAGRATVLVELSPLRRPRVRARLPGEVRALAVDGRRVWALTARGLVRWDPAGGVARPLPVPPGTRELTAAAGRVAVLAPATGTLVERTAAGAVRRHALPRPARGLTADAEGMWVCLGREAVPQRVPWGTG